MVMRSIRMKPADIRTVWNDSELTLQQAAQRMNISVDTLRRHAALLGLSQRPTGRREVIRPQQLPEFRTMWALGVPAREIGIYFGASYFAVISTAQRLGLTMRGAGYRPTMRLAAYRQQRLAATMLLQAKARR